MSAGREFLHDFELQVIWVLDFMEAFVNTAIRMKTPSLQVCAACMLGLARMHNVGMGLVSTTLKA